MTFQGTLPQPTGGVYNKSGVPCTSLGGIAQMSAWDEGFYWVMPNGYSSTAAGGVAQILPGQTPSDCIPTIFAVYGQDDGAFDALSLLG
jgi:hypothetical protein